MSIKKNSIINFSGSIIIIIITIVTIPIYLNVIGEERYGIMAIVWMLLGSFGLLDLGLGRATAKFISSTVDKEYQSKIFWNAFYLNVVLGLVVMSVLYPIAEYLFTSKFQLSNQLKNEITNSINWFIIGVPLAMVNGVLTGTLQGIQDFYKLNIFKIINSISIQVVPLLFAILVSPSIDIILPATIASKLVLTIGLMFWIVAKCGISFKISVDFSSLKSMVGFGGWVTVSSITTALITTSDRLMIGSILNAKSVAYYSVALNISNKLSIIPSSLSYALFPKLNAISTEERKKLSKQMSENLLNVMTPVYLIAIIAIKLVISIWISPEFAENSYQIAVILICAIWWKSIGQIPFSKIQSDGYPDIIAKINLIEIVPYFVMLYFGLTEFGLIGAGFVLLLRYFIDTLILFRFSKIAILGINIYINALLIISALVVSLYPFENQIFYYGLCLALSVISITYSSVTLDLPKLFRSKTTRHSK